MPCEAVLLVLFECKLTCFECLNNIIGRHTGFQSLNTDYFHKNAATIKMLHQQPIELHASLRLCLIFLSYHLFPVESCLVMGKVKYG